MIVHYHKDYTLRVSDGEHNWAQIVFPVKNGKPAISLQNADAIVRKQNPKLRLIRKVQADTFSTHVFRYYEVPKKGDER